MTWDIALTLTTVFVLFITFVRQTAETELLALAAASILVITGILSTTELLSVFSNPAAMTVGAMFILSAALDKTGVINILGKISTRIAEKSITLSIFVIFTAVFCSSFFINNTSVVLIMIPIIITLSKKFALKSSKFLIPLSYISILGGACTLIGTSTNLLVDGVVQKMGLKHFSMFEIMIPGLILASVGILYMLLIGHKLLPIRESLLEQFDHSSEKKYLSQLTINQESELIGKTIAESGFTRSKDFEVVKYIPCDTEKNHKTNLMIKFDQARIFLKRINHPNAENNIDMKATLQEGDKLIVLSDQRNILTADQNIGFTNEEVMIDDDTMTMEGVIAPHSSLIGRLIDHFNQNNHYNVQIIAIHSHAGQLSTDFNMIRLAVGQTILIKGEEKQLKKLREEQQFIDLSEPEHEPYHKKHAPIAILTLLAVILLATFHIIPIAGSSFIGAIFVMITGCIKMKDAYKALQSSVLFLIYAMLAISIAMEKTGALKFLVGHILQLVNSLSPAMIISILYLMTSCITEVFSNNAAALMLTPLAIELAQSLGVDPRPFAVAIMFGASASFATPIGYQTNTLVFHAGGYRFNDFLKIGIPLNILIWITASIVIPLYWKI